MVARKSLVHGQTPSIREELERLLDEATSPEEFLHALFSFLAELTARDSKHPVVLSLARELGRAAAQPVTHAYIHDLRNLMTVMRTALDVASPSIRVFMRDEPVESDMKARHVSNILGSLRDLDQALDRGFAVAMEARSVNVESESDRRCELPEVVESVTRMVTRMHSRAGIEMKVVPSVSVQAPRVGVFRVLLNLLENACDAVSAIDPASVSVTAWVSEADAFVQVADNGGGIPADEHENVFDLFYTTKTYGSGVGLFVCRTLVRGWGGHLQLDSKPGGGARFTLSIPRTDAP